MVGLIRGKVKPLSNRFNRFGGAVHVIRCLGEWAG
jgi:hypothetical protein